MENMNIRKALPKDIGAIGRLLQEISIVHHEGRPDLFKVGQKYDDKELFSVITDPSRLVLVAANEADEAVGYAICILQRPHSGSASTNVTTLYLDDLCVDSALRGKHIGHELMDAVKDAARKLGCYNLTLNVWACNPNAHRFYEQCGMRVQKYCMETIL